VITDLAAGVGYPQGAPRVTGPAMRPPHLLKKGQGC
jgi:hypothetical protein